MLIPWGTDAPIYHWPVATVGLIVANTAAFFATMNLDPETQASLAMRLGDGIHPLEWFTSIFCHANIQHLVGNMMFLWAFGIVVEGKLGWLRFLVVYLGIGVGESALEQLLFRTGTPGFSVGGHLWIARGLHGLGTAQRAPLLELFPVPHRELGFADLALRGSLHRH